MRPERGRHATPELGNHPAPSERRYDMGTARLASAGIFLAVLGLLVGACGTDNGSSGAPSTSDAPTTSQEASTTTTIIVDITPAPEKPSPTTTAPPVSEPGLPPGIDPRGNAQVAMAIADLAAMLGVDERTIDVVAWEEVVWRDGSIGCPQPGMAYTQALVDGSRIVLEHDGIRYAYHTARGRDPFYCADPAE